MSSSEANRIGEIVAGKYRVVRLLAHGGMGVVYEAQHAVVGRRFAIKFLRRELAARRDILTRFHREAQAAGALENDNVAAAVDFGISNDGTPFIVMEYLVGESLADLLERSQRLPVHRAADLVAQACRGVAAAHAAGIVHRDLKPQNLFVVRRDEGTDLLKVLDFGIAKLHTLDEAGGPTRSGTILGTAAYMSPEQARGETTVDARTDVYSLGAILYELLSGKRPHPGDSQNAVLHHIATYPAVPLESVQGDLPKELITTVARALASDAAARPASAGAFAEELAPFTGRLVWPAAPGASGPTPSGLAAIAIATPRTGSSARVAAVATLAVAASIAVILGLKPRFTSTRSRPAPARPLSEDTRFFVPASEPAAVEQFARLAAAGAVRDSSLLTSMEGTPRAVYFESGTPDQVEAAVRKAVLRAAQAGEIPVLVAYNLPYRDCAQYSVGGARDGEAYRAWIDGFVRGIGRERAVVILEPDGLGIIPYGVSLDGSVDWCKPTVSDSEGHPIAAPGATSEQRYALLAAAVDRLVRGATGALVYLDGTHSAWLPVGEAAQRLARAQVGRTRGFAVNVGNDQPTSEAVKYGTWISKCLLYAAHTLGASGGFRDCPGPRRVGTGDAMDWESADGWYADHVDHAPWSSTSAAEAAHFVIDTSRNGRGPLDVSVYAGPPFNQPPDVIGKLKNGAWCNSPNGSLGIRPTARTKIPLVDAFLWIKPPGQSDGSCDAAGGARAWDFSKFNPWGISGEPQRHFDPLWGMIDPPAGEWFPDAAVRLARNANPPLMSGSAPDVPSEHPVLQPTGLPPIVDPADRHR